MAQKVFFSMLLLVHYATQTISESWANCSEDVLLVCPDVNPDSMDYFSLIWYKFQNETKHAIIRRGKTDGKTLTYNFNRPAEFGKNLGLLLRNVTPLDSGRYECAISANVMGQNLNLQVNLVVNDCVTESPVTTTENVKRKGAENLPVMQYIIGFAVVGVTKIILSVFSIRVVHAVRMRSSRQQQHNW